MATNLQSQRTKNELFIIERWPWDEDPSAAGAQQFDGWPYRLPFAEADGRTLQEESG